MSSASAFKIDKQKHRILKWKHRKHPGTKIARKILSQHGRRFDKCERCGSDPCRTHIHHKNGNPYDNRIQNLIIVCGSCHRKIHGIVDPYCDYIDEAEFIDDEFGVVDDEYGVIDDKPDKTLIVVELDEKGIDLYQVHFPEAQKIVRPKHFYSRFKGYQCRHCQHFRPFKEKCEFWSQKTTEDDKVCAEFKFRGES